MNRRFNNRKNMKQKLYENIMKNVSAIVKKKIHLNEFKSYDDMKDRIEQINNILPDNIELTAGDFGRFNNGAHVPGELCFAMKTKQYGELPISPDFEDIDVGLDYMRKHFSFL